VAAVPAPPPPKAEAPSAPPPAARMEGRYQIQLAAVRTEAEARALAAKAKREAALASREPWIDHTVIGNMGAFYRVRFGPFASAQETQAVCAKLQGSGFDCMPVGP
jgi:cell division septation protein DedD